MGIRKFPVHFLKDTLNLKWHRGHLVPDDENILVLVDLKGRKQSPEKVLCLMPTRGDVNSGKTSFLHYAADAGYSVYEVDESGTEPFKLVVSDAALRQGEKNL